MLCHFSTKFPSTSILLPTLLLRQLTRYSNAEAISHHSTAFSCLFFWGRLLFLLLIAFIQILSSAKNSSSSSVAHACKNVIVEGVFCYYYVNLISQTITKQPFIFVAINQFITDSRKAIANILAAALQQQPQQQQPQQQRFVKHNTHAQTDITKVRKP